MIALPPPAGYDSSMGTEFDRNYVEPPPIIVGRPIPLQPAIAASPTGRTAVASRHWAKRAMIVVTIAWPLVTIGLIGLSIIATYANARRAGGGWVMDNVYFPAEDMTEIAFAAAFSWGSCATVAYFVAIATLGVLWFATKPE